MTQPQFVQRVQGLRIIRAREYAAMFRQNLATANPRASKGPGSCKRFPSPPSFAPGAQGPVPVRSPRFRDALSRISRAVTVLPRASLGSDNFEHAAHELRYPVRSVSLRG